MPLTREVSRVSRDPAMSPPTPGSERATVLVSGNRVICLLCHSSFSFPLLIELCARHWILWILVSQRFRMNLNP